MPGFLYFVTDGHQGQWSLSDMRDAGLGHAVEPASRIQSCGCAAGPDGAKGVVLADRPGGDVGYFPDRQTWRKIPGAAACWVGMARSARPGPEDLRRADALAGHAVRLADGVEWIVPIARAWETDTDQPTWYEVLPRVLDWNESGERVPGEVVASRRPLWEAACRWWDARLGATVDDRVVHFSEAVESDLALVALAANYRIGKAEAGLLGLLDERTEIDVLDAIIDWSTWVEWAQKKTSRQADRSDSEPGPPADSPDTDPVSPS